MNIKSIFVATTLALATTGAFAADTSYVRTPGEGIDYPYVDSTQGSTVSRSAVRQAAVAQDARHALSGEIGADVEAFDDDTVASSTLTRAQVRSQVLAARANGTLPAPGDEPNYPDVQAAAPTVRFDTADHPSLVKIDQWLKSRVERVATAGSN